MSSQRLRRRPLLGLAAGLILLAGLALSLTSTVARSALAQAQGPEVTVYNSNIAVVKERRQFELDKGVNLVDVADVPSGIQPDTVLFRSTTDPDAAVLEQNYEYDLVGSQALLQKYIDQEIRVVSNDGVAYEGVLLSADGDVILQNADGGVQVIKYDQIREYSFPALPEGLITKPTLVWTVDATKAGRHEAEITYLTNGLNWNASYVLLLADDSKSVDLDGWITLDNRSGASYKDAKLKLVAGDVHRVTKPIVLERLVMDFAAEAPAPTPAVEERTFAEYHLYEMQRPVTIKDKQTKQVQFVSAGGVAAEKTYTYDGSTPYGGYGPNFERNFGSTGNTKIDVSLTFNTGKDGVDAELPAGVIRMYQTDIDGAQLLIGEDNIDHTPKGEDVTLTIGQAFDLVGERKQTDFERIGDNVVEETYEIELRNQKESEDVVIRVVEHLSRGTNWQIRDASPVDFEKTDSATIEWKIPVPAQGKATVKYTVRYTF
ncbi:MAG: DUF4139 domain-containing protein [Caldilineales bacterium]|nr:DUF4139 domain-containing protein [Caldilineales bacterium]MCW5860971.1 DUF4139 domain-containing protein [Caldilineales bacterium]